MQLEHVTLLSISISVAGSACYPASDVASDPWEVCVDDSGGWPASAAVDDLPPSGTECAGDGWGCTGGGGDGSGWSLFCVRGRMAVVSYAAPPSTEGCEAFRRVTPSTTDDSCRLDLTWCGPMGLGRADVVERGCSSAAPGVPGSQPPGDCADTLRRGRPGDSCEGTWTCGEMRGGMVETVWCAGGVLHYGQVPFA